MIASTNRPQLFHAPFACSLAVRFAAAWGDMTLDVLPVKLGRTATDSEKRFLAVNPVGQVSTMILRDETILTETSACLIWVQSHSMNIAFRRDPNSPDYFQMLRWISFCGTELHKQLLRIVLYDEATETVKNKFRTLAKLRLAFLEKHLSGRHVLVGDTLSAADAYLTWFLTLSEKAGVEFASYPNLSAYFARQSAHEDVTALLAEDRLLKTSLT